MMQPSTKRRCASTKPTRHARGPEYVDFVSLWKLLGFVTILVGCVTFWCAFTLTFVDPGPLVALGYFGSAGALLFGLGCFWVAGGEE